MIKQKPDTKQRTTYREAQLNWEELSKSIDSPVEIYNRYVRKEGEPILTEKEFESRIRQRNELKARKTAAQYPFTPAESVLYKVATEKIEELLDKNMKVEKSSEVLGYADSEGNWHNVVPGTACAIKPIDKL